MRLYVDGRGHFRDSARMLLAELYMDVIADELARRMVARSARPWGEEVHQAAKREDHPPLRLRYPPRVPRRMTPGL